MPVEADDSLPTTSSGSDGTENIAALRWVYPPGDLLTVLSDVPAVLGRSPQATTQLDTSRVSRRHAEVARVSGSFVVRDLDSKNGVYVNAERVLEAPLRKGDVLRIGDCVAVTDTVSLNGLPGFRDLGQGILGGPSLAPIVESVRQAAARGADVLLLGEPGTGKELMARALHRYSARTGAFVIFDCAAAPESTREADLLGRGAGSLPDGEHASIGLVRAAHQGTLLLDELLDLPIDLQTKLVRVLERREVVPLGEQQPVPVDVRFVAKSSLAFEDQPAARLDANLQRHFGAIIRLPTLRERRSDIVPLFASLLARHGFEGRPRLEPELVEHLCLRDWPMNVRELDGLARRVILSHTSEKELKLREVIEWAPPTATGARPTPAPQSAAARRSLTPYPTDQLAALREALERHQGNLTKAANELGITRSKAYRMLNAGRPEE
jgi:DNA-binding NtrC family response regulator